MAKDKKKVLQALKLQVHNPPGDTWDTPSACSLTLLVQQPVRGEGRRGGCVARRAETSGRGERERAGRREETPPHHARQSVVQRSLQTLLRRVTVLELTIPDVPARNSLCHGTKPGWFRQEWDGGVWGGIRGVGGE